MTSATPNATPLPLKGYITYDPRDVIIRPNVVRRKWIERETGGNGYRCLPLNMASSLGWSLLTPFKFAVTFDGETLTVIAKDRRINPSRLVTDQFRAGIFTFYLSVLFRTPPGHDLFVTGPLNQPKRGAAPLSGLVETDWPEVTFTMNWKITELNFPVVFEAEEPFCTFFPYPRHYVERFDPVLCDIRDEPAMRERYHRWLKHRLSSKEVEGHYLRGEHFIDPKAGVFADHQWRLPQREFRKVTFRGDGGASAKADSRHKERR